MSANFFLFIRYTKELKTIGKLPMVYLFLWKENKTLRNFSTAGIKDNPLGFGNLSSVKILLIVSVFFGF